MSKAGARTHFIMTTGIENYPYYALIQLMLRARITNILSGITGFDYDALARELLLKYIDVPDFVDDKGDQKLEAWVSSEKQKLLHGFNTFENNPTYQESILMLKAYEGEMFSIASVTEAGIMVNLYDPEGKYGEAF